MRRLSAIISPQLKTTVFVGVARSVEKGFSLGVKKAKRRVRSKEVSVGAAEPSVFSHSKANISTRGKVDLEHFSSLQTFWKLRVRNVWKIAITSARRVQPHFRLGHRFHYESVRVVHNGALCLSFESGHKTKESGVRAVGIKQKASALGVDRSRSVSDDKEPPRLYMLQLNLIAVLGTYKTNGLCTDVEN